LLITPSWVWFFEQSFLELFLPRTAENCPKCSSEVQFRWALFCFVSNVATRSLPFSLYFSHSSDVIFWG
jgi:hypothetical protein